MDEQASQELAAAHGSTAEHSGHRWGGKGGATPLKASRVLRAVYAGPSESGKKLSSRMETLSLKVNGETGRAADVTADVHVATRVHHDGNSMVLGPYLHMQQRSHQHSRKTHSTAAQRESVTFKVQIRTPDVVKDMSACRSCRCRKPVDPRTRPRSSNRFGQ
jgi:hypothetical protein